MEIIDRAVAERAAAVLPARGAVLTCGDGTGVDALLAAHRAGKLLRVYVCETRPSLAGRSATDRLSAAGISATPIVDGAAAATMRAQRIAAVIVGAERIAANGDTRAVLGTYALALAAAHHGVPLYVAAPRATIDEKLERDDEFGLDGLDVTPGHLIAGIVTEYGPTRPPYHESIPDLATRPLFAAVARRE